MPIRADTGRQLPVQMKSLQATEGHKCKGFVKDRGIILPPPLAWTAWETEVVGEGQCHRKRVLRGFRGWRWTWQINLCQGFKRSYRQEEIKVGRQKNRLEGLSHTCLLDGDKTLQWRTKKTDGALHLNVSSLGGKGRWMGAEMVSLALSRQAEVMSMVLNRN